MAEFLDPVWGPFTDAGDARSRLCALVNKGSGSGVGVFWSANDILYPLRRPGPGADGFRDVVAFQWSPVPPPRPPRRVQPHGFGARLRAFIYQIMAEQGQAQIAQGQAYQAEGQLMIRGISRLFTTHVDDGLGVAFDAIAVAASVALIPSGLGVLGMAALFAGGFLFLADGAAYVYELGGNESRAETIKHQTERLRILATIITLPDLFLNGFRVMKEFKEIGELRKFDQLAAVRLASRSKTTTNTFRAQRLANLADRANLRAQIRSQQLSAIIKLEFAPRPAGVASVGLLIREEIETKSSTLNEIMMSLSIHSMAIKQ